MAYIYKIINLITGKMYIGETTNCKQRWSQHLMMLNAGKHHSQKLQRAFDKYHAENFQFQVIEEIEDEKRFEREIFYIDFYNSYEDGYNETRGGDNPGYEKLLKTVYCYNQDGIYLKTFQSGRQASRELGIDQALLQKICVGLKKTATGKDGQVYRFSYIWYECLPVLEYHNGNSRAIIQKDKEGNVLNYFASGAEANRYLGLSSRSTKIYAALKNKTLYHKCYWEYQ